MLTRSKDTEGTSEAQAAPTKRGGSVEATVLWVDLHGFSTLTEILGIQGRMVSFMEDYYNKMGVYRANGSPTKVVGDGLLFIFYQPYRRQLEPRDFEEQRLKDRTESIHQALETMFGLQTSLESLAGFSRPPLEEWRKEIRMAHNGVLLTPLSDKTRSYFWTATKCLKCDQGHG